jgi:hypothetical protein
MEAVRLFIMTRLAFLYRGSRVLYIVILLLLLLETGFILTRGVDSAITSEAALRYPATSVHFDKSSIDTLRSLSGSTAVQPASGKGNPFTP